MENGMPSNGQSTTGNPGNGLTGTGGAGTAAGAQAFTFPLPGNSSAASTTPASTTSGSHTAPATEESPSSSATFASEHSRDLEARGRTIMRRDAMGVAGVRTAGRLAHAELVAEHLASGRNRPVDPFSDNDEMLEMLGDYLEAAGFERPEIHAKLGGQSIVVDLRSPARRS
ncbi:hypothetical protein G4H71_04845 [Rhodococcus triatomae]|uniref:Uncharacterized protein n=1 Tax=Rhodococcus triatomae TaxID=300028 RepID=A0A1G8A1Q1_9NOCA|nr:hypothetical protein [Rhodococcus triatomae]QNG17883.1 hypothetical protein G4H72_03200 [Rhodococcus triatomae]QNG22449.1 hypothetical protein G4H71_04845 [Rhodococcus triatomae]SDH14854.1 hypothetical protein SAMN05444695_101294 [Rhodococcus triatomae]